MHFLKIEPYFRTSPQGLADPFSNSSGNRRAVEYCLQLCDLQARFTSELLQVPSALFDFFLKEDAWWKANFIILHYLPLVLSGSQ